MERTGRHHSRHGGGAGERGGQARQGAEVLSPAASIPSQGLSWEGQDAGPLVAFGARTARGQEWSLGAGRPLVQQEVEARRGLAQLEQRTEPW